MTNNKTLQKAYSLSDITFAGLDILLVPEFLLFFHLLLNMQKEIHGSHSY